MRSRLFPLALLLALCTCSAHVVAPPVGPPWDQLAEHASTLVPTGRYDGLESAATFSLNPDADDGVFEYGGSHSSPFLEPSHQPQSQLYGQGQHQAAQIDAHARSYLPFGHAQDVYRHIFEPDGNHVDGGVHVPMPSQAVKHDAFDHLWGLSQDFPIEPWTTSPASGPHAFTDQGRTALTSMHHGSTAHSTATAGLANEPRKTAGKKVRTKGKASKLGWQKPPAGAFRDRFPDLAIVPAAPDVFERKASSQTWIRGSDAERDLVRNRFLEALPPAQGEQQYAEWVESEPHVIRVQRLVDDLHRGAPATRFNPPFRPYIVNHHLIYLKQDKQRSSSSSNAKSKEDAYLALAIPLHDNDQDTATDLYVTRSLGFLRTNVPRTLSTKPAKQRRGS